MKNFLKARVAPFFGIIVLVAVIGFTMTACDDGSGKNESSSLNGTWVYSEYGISTGFTFNNGSFETSMNNVPHYKGTYTTSGNMLTMYLTHYYGKSLLFEAWGLDAKWYTITEFLDVYKKKVMAGGRMTEEEWAELGLESISGRSGTYTYSVNGNKLTLIMDMSQYGGTGTQTITFTRK